jgi:hypothetical protein
VASVVVVLVFVFLAVMLWRERKESGHGDRVPHRQILGPFLG